MSIALYTELGIIIDINSLLKHANHFLISFGMPIVLLFLFRPWCWCAVWDGGRAAKKEIITLSLHRPPRKLRGCLATGICDTVIETESPSNMVYQPQPLMISFFSSPNIPGPGTSISSILDERRAIHTRLADYRMSVNFSSTRSYTKYTSTRFAFLITSCFYLSLYRCVYHTHTRLSLQMSFFLRYESHKGLGQLEYINAAALLVLNGIL